MTINDEQDLIGSLLARPEFLPDVQAVLSSSDFTDNGCRAAFDWLATGKHGGARAPVEFCKWVAKTRTVFGGDGADLPNAQNAIIRRMAEYGSGSFAVVHAKAVANEAALWRVARLADDVRGELASRDQTDHDSGAAIVERIAGRVAELQAKSARGDVRRLSDVIPIALQEIEARLAGQSTLGLATGFTGLDRMLSGLRPQQLVIVAARPGVGKSALAGNIAANICERGGQVFFSSMEMTAEELTERMIASRAGVCLSAMTQGAIGPTQRAAIVENATMLRECELSIDDRHGQRVADIVAQARRIQSRGGLGLVIVDYLQLVQPLNPRDPRQEQVASISRALKSAAKSLNVPVLCLAQLNRQADTPNEPPRLSHLRESGAIEQDADVVMMLHAPPQPHGDSGTDVRPMQLVIAKQRNGPTGTINLEYKASVLTFSEVEPKRFDMLPHRVEPTSLHDEFGVEQFS